jgi:hypothetical protein
MNSFPHCNFYYGVDVVVSCLSMIHVNVEGPLNILMLVKKNWNRFLLFSRVWFTLFMLVDSFLLCFQTWNIYTSLNSFQIDVNYKHGKSLNAYKIRNIYIFFLQITPTFILKQKIR